MQTAEPQHVSQQTLRRSRCEGDMKLLETSQRSACQSGKNWQEQRAQELIEVWTRVADAREEPNLATPRSRSGREGADRCENTVLEPWGFPNTVYQSNACFRLCSGHLRHDFKLSVLVKTSTHY
jgi:hypothetical protein